LRGDPGVEIGPEDACGSTSKADAAKLAPGEQLVEEGSRDPKVGGSGVDAKNSGRGAQGRG
jgi:hypothetical protein